MPCLDDFKHFRLIWNLQCKWSFCIFISWCALEQTNKIKIQNFHWKTIRVWFNSIVFLVILLFVHNYVSDFTYLPCWSFIYTFDFSPLKGSEEFLFNYYERLGIGTKIFWIISMVSLTALKRNLHWWQISHKITFVIVKG